ncbi:MAG: ABC transporter permease [Denitromonas halophila]|nr:MAG: ABC transporter permease [Denitromonas halophila]
MSTDTLTLGAASPEPITGLKQRLRRAERRRKLLYGALIAPLALFLLVAFLWPIGALLMRSIDNPEVRGVLPQTLAILDTWSEDDLPPAEAYAALASELTSYKGTPELGGAAKRLNRETPGYRSLIMKTARKMPLAEGVDPQGALMTIDSRWSNVDIWHTIKRTGTPYTAFYMLSALDLDIHADGSLSATPPEEAIYLDILARTFWMSLIVAVCCLLLGFPVAYLMATLPQDKSNTLMIFVLLPFWTSVLVRVAAWIVLLQNEGLVNQALMALGITDAPLQLVFNRTGVYIAMVHILLPFMVLPLYSVMKGISPVYMRAAMSLGCPPFKSFWKVYFPQTLPGIGAGTLLVFIICMGYYITPALLGGPQEQMVSYFIAFYTNQTINWGMAAALSTVLLAATLVLYVFYARRLGANQAPAGR